MTFRFRWAYCQLETLRWCPLRDIPTALKELPKTLDRTYERILQDIPERMQKDAHRIIQWLTVSSRPMCVDELAEVFAINFDAETSGIPKFDPSWRPLNAEAAVLSACSTLVSVVNHGSGKVVQFAHFSVKEYLTSDRHCKFGTCFPLSRPPQISTFTSLQSVSQRPPSARLQHRRDQDSELPPGFVCREALDGSCAV